MPSPGRRCGSCAPAAAGAPDSRARRARIIKPTISQHVGLAWLKGDPMLPMTKAVVELMEDALHRGLVSQQRV